LNISDFIKRSEPEQLVNIAIFLEKALNDKIILTDEEKVSLDKIMKKIEELENSVFDFSLKK